MIVTKREERKNARNNASSVSCDHYSFVNLSRNNNSNATWRKRNNKNGTKSKR